MKTKIGKRVLPILLSLALLIGLMPVTAFAAESSTPTRTTTLDLSQYTETTDMLDTEGWKWEPRADGGTLTLKDCHIRTNKRPVLVFPGGPDNYNVEIKLIGNNVLETTAFVGGSLVTDSYALVTLNLTITGEEDASLACLVPYPEKFDVEPASYPYIFAAQNFTLKSGNVYVNTTFGVIDKDISIEGGSLTVEANRNLMDQMYKDSTDGLYSREGDVTISGGTVTIDVGRNGIFIPGTYASADAGQAVRITGGNVTIKAGHANNSQNCIGVAAKNIYIDTEDPIEIYGRDTALAIWFTGGEAEITKIGTEFSLSKSEESNFNLIYQRDPDTNPITICDANYDGVDAAIQTANKLNSDLYKDFSAVTGAINKVERNKTALEQPEVSAMAKAIEDAIAALQYKDADYSAVQAAVKKATALNKSDYKDFSKVEAALQAVEEGKNITEQAEVDAMAKAIEDAIAALEENPSQPEPDPDDTTDVPATGNSSNLLLWTVFALLSAGVLTGTVLRRNRKPQ